MTWLALFSQTGSEICNLSEAIGRYPDLVISDNVKVDNNVDERIEQNCKKVMWRAYRKLTPAAKLDYFRNFLGDYDIITLHGWLNIIPPEICEEFTIYNGHPGLINYYPQLKGKDPVDKVWANISDFMYVGSVIHKVTAKVDCGDIICASQLSYVNCTSLEETYNVARRTSLTSWIDFFTKEYYNSVC